MPIQLTTDDIKGVADSMNNWQRDMKTIAQHIYTKISSVNSWQDEQSLQFKEVAGLVLSGLKTNIDNLEKTSVFLKRYALKMEEETQKHSQRINNIRGH